MAFLSDEELYAKFAGMAVMSAVRAWGRWSCDLGVRGWSQEDLKQEAALVLLEIITVLEDRPQPSVRAYISKRLKYMLFDRIEIILLQNPPTTDTESVESCEEIQKSLDIDTEKLRSSLYGDDKIVLKLLQDGHNMTAITAMTGISAHKIRRSKNRIRRSIDRWRRE